MPDVDDAGDGSLSPPANSHAIPMTAGSSPCSVPRVANGRLTISPRRTVNRSAIAPSAAATPIIIPVRSGVNHEDY